MCAIMGFTKKSRTREEILPYFDQTLSRGPDMSSVVETPSGWLCFHRLAIMGLDESGMQPFSLDGDMVVCNGELYGWRELRTELEGKGYTFQSGSDCELLLPLYREYGLDMFSMLDAEFALILYDGRTGSAPCSTAMTTTEASSLPARPRTSSACAKRCSPSRPATTTPAASSSATPI